MFKVPEHILSVVPSADTPRKRQAPGTTEQPLTSNESDNCSDIEMDCQAWASAGECEKNPKYLYVHCKKSCNQCTSSLAPDHPDSEGEKRTSGGLECQDQDPSCGGWAAAGECKKNPVYLKVTVALTLPLP